MNNIITRRRAGAGVAVGALVASALMFAPAAQAAISDVRESQIAPNESTYEGWHQGAEGGKATVVNEGLKLEGRSQVIKGYANNKVENLNDGVKNVELSTLADAKFTKVSGGDVTFQVPLFSDAIAGNKFATLRTVDASTGTWQSSKAIGEIPANTDTTLVAITEAIGTQAYKVIAFGVYNQADTAVVKDITFDGTTYTFKNNAPVSPARTVTGKINTPLQVTLSASDVDGNALTYKVTGVVGGTVSGTEPTVTFTPAAGFKGNATITYTIDDGRGGVTTATTTVNVVKLKGKVEIYRVHPTTPSVRSTVSVYATVTVDGKQAKTGTTVYGYAKSKKVVTGKVNSKGKVKLTLPNKLPAGKATLKVTQAGSSTTNGGTDSIAVRVKK